MMAPMSEPPFLSIVRIWAAMAWADGVIVPAEAKAMKEFISLSPLDEQEQKKARSWLKKKVELEDDEFQDLSQSARVSLYRSAARIAALDRVIADEERAFLDSLRDSLEVSAEQAAKIEASVFAQHRVGEDDEPET